MNRHLNFDWEIQGLVLLGLIAIAWWLRSNQL